MLGRSFSAEDDTPGAPRRVMLTHGYWQRRFGGADTVVGQQLVIDGTSVEVIGVLPASFKFLRTRPAIVLPMPLDANAPRFISFGFQALARLKPGVTLAQANADVARMISLLPPMFARLELRPNVRPLATDVIRDVGQILWILMAAVGVVLLIACGNVANLFLVRAEGRHQELAVRAALGASRGRIARALLSESVVLALAGGLLGVFLAQAAIGLLRTIAPAELPRVDDIGIDWMVLLFTVSVSVLSGALCGALAVIRFGKPGIAALKEGGRSSSDAPGRHRTRDALVVGQVALALTLLIVSGLMIRTFIAMRQVDPGFTRPEEVQTFVIAIPASLDQRSRADGAHVRGRYRTTGARARRHLGWSLVFHHDGRRRQQQLRRHRGVPRPGRDDGQAPAVQEHRAGVFRDDGQPAGRRALDHLERHPRAAARRHHFRATGARVLGRAGEGDRQASPRQFSEISVARNHRRVRQRTRRWTVAAADSDRLLADAE